MKPRDSRRLTGFGWLTLSMAAICIGAVGFNNAWSPAALGLCLLSCILVAVLLTPRPFGSLRRRWLLPDSIHAGELSQLGLEFTASRAVPPILLSLKTRTRIPVVSWTWLTGLVNGPVRVRWPTQFRRRGWQKVPELQLHCRHPFGLVEARTRQRDSESVLVFPRLGHVDERLIAGLNRWFQDMHARPRRGDEEFGWLRPYRPGDPPRTVNWKASARTRTLQVTHREGTPSRDLTLWIDTSCRPQDHESFERVISCAATLVDELAPRGWRIRLCGEFAGEGLTGRRNRLMEALALLKPTREKLELPELDGPTLVLTAKPDRHAAPSARVRIIDAANAITFEDEE